MSASISQRGTRCIYCSRHASRAAARCYGTVASSKHDRDLRLGPLPDVPVSQPQSWKTGPNKITRGTTRPSILLPREAAQTSTPKIHILGEDERSKFIAHALSGLYESVEMMGLPRRYAPAMREPSEHIKVTQELVTPAKRTGIYETTTQEITRQEEDKDDPSRIDQLVVSGRGHQAMRAVESVKDRLDKDSTVCFVNDGLGFLDDVKQKLFAGTKQTPKFLLGHMSHRLAYDRGHNHIKQMKPGRLYLTPSSWNALAETKRQQKMSKRLVDNLQGVSPYMLPFDRWLRFKLPDVLFGTVVESTCVFLDLPYSGLLNNPAAVRTMTSILDEIKQVLMNMPQLRGSESVQNFVEGSRIWQVLYSSIMQRKDQPSRLGKLIAQGRPTDINFLHGYFINQARSLQIDTPHLSFMKNMIMAKHSRRIEEMNSWIDVEETSVPADLGFRYRKMKKRN